MATGPVTSWEERHQWPCDVASDLRLAHTYALGLNLPALDRMASECHASVVVSCGQSIGLARFAQMRPTERTLDILRETCGDLEHLRKLSETCADVCRRCGLVQADLHYRSAAFCVGQTLRCVTDAVARGPEIA
jgi:hypothetical protein